MTPPRLVRLGLLGCGWIATSRLRQIAAENLADVTVVADPDPRARQAARLLAPGARTTRDLDGMDLASVDGVMISTPSALHCDQAAALLEWRVPVFVQKPMGLCANDVGRLVALAAEADLPLATDLCYRSLNSARLVRRALLDRTIGTPFRVETCFHNAYRPGTGWSHDATLAGGGALMDLGIHLLDLVMWLMDEPLALEDARLLCRGRPWSAGDVEDFAALDLALKSGGGQVRLVTSWDASTGRDAQIELRIYGDGGCLEIRNRDGSFFDFDGFRYQGTGVEHLACDRGHAWQAEPLRQWLRQVADGSGFRRTPWVERSLILIDQAYGLYRRSPPSRSAAPGTVHVLGRKGVLQ